MVQLLGAEGKLVALTKAALADGADEIHQMRIAENTIKAYTSFGSTRTATGDLPV